MNIIDSFEGFCQEMIIPALKEDAANGRWEGVSPSNFHEDKGDNYYVVFLNHVVNDKFTVQLGLWGMMEDNNSFVVNCKCLFANEGPVDIQIEEEKKDFMKNCSLAFSHMGFGVEQTEEGFCVWASLDEEDGEYVVTNVDNPYSLYSTFIDVIERNVIECYAS